MIKHSNGFYYNTSNDSSMPLLRERLSSSSALSQLQKNVPWVGWSYQVRGERRTKPPVNPRTGEKASVADPSTWGTCEEALACVTSGKAEGVGIVLTGKDGIVGVDLDHCISEDGTIVTWVQDILDLRETYAEVSPSGTGIRMLACGALGKALKSAAMGVELYESGRYLTITGNMVPGCPDEIKEAPETLRRLRARVTEKQVEQALIVNIPMKANDRPPAATGKGYFRNVNDAALSNLDAWVPLLLPMATRSSNGYRVSSHDLNRDLEEDLSITIDGIIDFGVADQGDVQDGRRTPLDLVIEYGEEIGLKFSGINPGDDEATRTISHGINALAASDWLCAALTLSPWQLEKQPITDENWLEFLNENHAVVSDGGRTWVLRIEYDFQASPPYRKLVFETFSAFRECYMNKLISVSTVRTVFSGGSQKEQTSEEQVSVAKWWLNHPKRRQYKGVVFIPGEKGEINGYLNRWTGFAVEPVPGDWSLMEWHIRNVLAGGNSELTRYILNWCAFAVQYPMNPAEAVLVFKGKRGTGKGILCNALKDLFGQHGMRISNPDHLIGHFNAHLQETVLLFADEAFWPGNKAAEGSLKGFITEHTSTFEKKGRDASSGPNRLHIVMASNEAWVVPAGPEERRYCVIDVSDIKMQNHDYFKAIAKQMKAGGLNAMLYDLLKLNISDWHPRMVPMTEALADQQDITMSAQDAWWETKLKDGFILNCHSQRPDWVATQFILSDLQAFSPKLMYINEKSLATILKGYGCQNGGKHGRNRGWLLPNLGEARANWKRHYKGTVWDDPEKTEWSTANEAVEDMQITLYRDGKQLKLTGPN